MAGLLLLLGSCVIVGRARLVGTTKCTRGPSQWCSGLKSSAKCKATSYCIDHYWKNKITPEDDDDVCKICKDMVKQARDQLLSNETQEEIKEVFEGSCDLIPIKIIAHECEKLADEFIPELVETLASEMNPDTVCTVSGLCNSQWIDGLLEEYKRRPENEAEGGVGGFLTDCDLCHGQMLMFSQNVRDTDKNVVLDRSLAICGKFFASYSDACKLTILDNFEELYRFLLNLDGVGMCESSDMCSGNGSTTFVATGQDLPCEFCEKVIQHWIDTLTAAEGDYKRVLESICKRIDEPDRIKRCLRIVDDYYVPIFEFILHTINSQEVCSAVRICHHSLKSVTQEPPLTVLLPHDATVQQQQLLLNIQDASPLIMASTASPRLIGGYFMPKTVYSMKQPGCEVCKLVLFKLEAYLSDEGTRDDVEKGLDKVCGEIPMPSMLGVRCRAVVDMYGPAIADRIVENVAPEDVCDFLHLCLMGEGGGEEEESLDESRWLASRRRSEKCAECQRITETVLRALRDENTEEEIGNLIQTTCRLLPSSLEAECWRNLKKYAQWAIEAIVQDVSAGEVCEALNICEHKEVAPRNDKRCVFCEYVFTTLDDVLEDRKNKEAIEEALDKVCDILPKKEYTEVCEKYVKAYSQIVIDMIVNDFTPDQICHTLGLCQNHQQSDMNVISMELDVEEVAGDKPYCMVCEVTIRAVDMVITDKQNEEDIKNVVVRICHMLSTSMQKECLNIVNEYFDDIVDMVTKDYTPVQICTALRMCTHQQAVTNYIAMEREGGGIAGERPYCMLCEVAIGEVDKVITDKHNEDKIKNVMDRVCNMLSTPIQKECTNMINEFMDNIAHMLAEEHTPAQICTSLGLCKTAAIRGDYPMSPGDQYGNEIPPLETYDVQEEEENFEMLDKSAEEDSGEEAVGGPVCDICEWAMRVLERQIFNNRSMDMVERALKMVCSHFPESVAEECEDFVQKYGDQILSMIVEVEMNPGEICTELNLCHGTKLWDAKLVGGIKCNWGPALWCASRFHAETCGTAAFCAQQGIKL